MAIFPAAGRNQSFGEGLGSAGLQQARQNLSDPQVPRNGVGTPSFVSSPTEGAGMPSPAPEAPSQAPSQGSRPIDQLRTQLQQQASATPPGPGIGQPGPSQQAYGSVKPGMTMDEFRQNRAQENGPQAPPVVSKRQFGVSDSTLMAAHQGLAGASAAGRLMGPGGLRHLLNFAAGTHLHPATTTPGRMWAARQPGPPPKPPRISG